MVIKSWDGCKRKDVCVLCVCLAVFVCVCVTWWMSRSSVRSNLCVSEGGLVHSSHVSLLTYYSIDNISLSLCSPEYSVFVLLLFSSSFYKLFSRPSSVIICSQISLRNQRLSIILRVARWKILSCFFLGGRLEAAAAGQRSSFCFRSLKR